MTTELIAAPKRAKQDEQDKQDKKLAVFPEYPPRDDMQNSLYLDRYGHATELELHLGNPDTTLVLGEVSVAPTADFSKEYRRPDLLVSFDCDPDLVVRQNGYAIDTQGKPPDFALEVASRTTGIIDFTEKRIDYAAYGIREYWRYDQTGGDYHEAALAGDRLVDGEYQRIDVEWHDDMRCSGYSEVLDLYVCWEYGNLRWYDHRTGKYLPTFYEERDMRLEAEARAEREAFARQQEASARRQAETRADQAETRADQAQAENQRLRAEIETLRRSIRSDEEN